MFNAGIFSLSVFSDKDSVDIVVGCFVTSNRLARSDVGKEVECAAQRKVQGNMPFADRRLTCEVSGVVKGSSS